MRHFMDNTFYYTNYSVHKHNWNSLSYRVTYVLRQSDFGGEVL